MPEGAVERLAGLNNRLGEHRQKVDELGRLMARLQAESDGLAINEAVVQSAPRIEALREQETWIGTLEKGVGESEGEIARLEAQLKAQQQQLGLDEQAGGDGLRAITSQTLASLREPALSLRRCQRRLEKIKQQSGIGQQHDRGLAAKIEEALHARGEKDLSEAVEHGGLLVAQLRRRVQLDQRVEKLEHYQAEMDHQSRRLLEHQLLPVWMLAGLGGVFVIGVVLLMAGLLIPGSIAEVWGWCLALLGLSATICSVATKFLLERTNARRLETCQKQLHTLQAQLKQAAQERAALDEQLPAGSGTAGFPAGDGREGAGGPGRAVPMDSQRKSMKQAAEEASATGSPGGGQPVGGRAALAGGPLQGRSAADAPSQAGADADRPRRRNRRPQAAAGRPLRGVPAAEPRAGSDLRPHPPARRRDQCQAFVDARRPIRSARWSRRLEEQQSLLKRREALLAEIRQLRRKKIKHGKAIARWTRDRRELLHAAGVESEEQFHARAAELARVEGLKQQRQSIQREIDAAIAGHCDLETLRSYLEGPAEESLEARRHQVQERLSAAEAQLRERFEQRGRLGEQIKVLAHDRQPAEKQLALGMVEQRIRESIRTWQVRAVTSQVLESIRKTYEKERQPETLQEASGYLERMTEGRYGRIWTPLDEKVLLVDDAAGRPLAIEVLSQGTREQLFLALRLALVSSYARRRRRAADDPRRRAGELRQPAGQGGRGGALRFRGGRSPTPGLHLPRAHPPALQALGRGGDRASAQRRGAGAAGRPQAHGGRAATEAEAAAGARASRFRAGIGRRRWIVQRRRGRGDAETRRRGEEEKRRRGEGKLGAIAGSSSSADGTVRQAERGTPAPPKPPPPSRPVRPAAEEPPSRRGRLVPWNAPWGEEKPKEQPSVFVNERNELEYVDSDAEPLDYTHQPMDDAAGSDDDPFQDDEEEGGFDPDDDPDFGPDFDHGYEDEQGYLDARGDAEAA